MDVDHSPNLEKSPLPQSPAFSEDEALPSAYSEDLGTIEVRLRRVRDWIAVPFTPKTSSKPSPVTVHERSKKGHGPGHCVSYVSFTSPYRP